MRVCLLYTLLIFGSLSLTSCETDVELDAPYKSTPVIVGILDFRADSQFVRINRTFLGEGDANVYAGIRDSVEYAEGEVDAWLVKTQNGNAIDSILLQYIELPSRDPGAFYNTNVGFYYTAQPLFTNQEINNVLNEPSASPGSAQRMRYKLRVTVRGKTYTAETNFPSIGSGSITFPPNTNPPVKLEFYRATSNTFQTLDFHFKTNNNTARYIGVLRLNYELTTSDGNTATNQVLDYDLGLHENELLATTQTSFLFNSQNWYSFIGQRILAIPNVEKIRIVNLEFRLTGGNEDLNTYINTTLPINDGITPILNYYSNFDNEAIGILAARSTTVTSAWLLDPSLNIMNTSDLTAGPCYCDVNWSGSSLVCTNSLINCP